MTITPPTAAQFKARYPLFVSVDDTLVDLVIGEAVSGYVDETWRVADQVPAILALTAHLLAMEGHPLTTVEDDGSSGGGGGGSTVTDRKVASIKVGDVAVSYKDGATTTSGGGSGSGGSSSGSSNLDTTAYGQQFVRLRNKNFPAVAIV